MTRDLYYGQSYFDYSPRWSGLPCRGLDVDAKTDNLWYEHRDTGDKFAGFSFSTPMASGRVGVDFATLLFGQSKRATSSGSYISGET